MTPAFLILLFLSAITAAAVPSDPPIEEQDTFGTIEAANGNATTPLEDGDLVPTVATRNADPCVRTGCMWPKQGSYVYVPVSIDSSTYTRSERNFIIRGLLTFHSSTCIRFHWRRTIDRQFIHFFSGDGCWSSLGRQRSGQAVSLKKNGCLFTDTVQHEVLHALGFHHEQVRSDRDQHVNILTQNIRQGAERNFAKKNTNNLNTPYDFDSVMQYGNYAFSSNGKPTIVSKADVNRRFGLATEMSQYDINRVNALYGCSV